MSETDALKERILSLMESQGQGFFPHELAKILNKKDNTVRSACSRMAKEGLLIQNFDSVPGCYGLNKVLRKRPDGMVLPRVQNMWVVAPLNGPVNTFKQIENLPDDNNPFWKVMTIIGSKSKQVCIRLSGEFGFDFPAVYFILSRKLEELNKQFGFDLKPSDMILHNVEIFNDFYGLSLSRNSITLSDMHSVLTKFYNKGNLLRVEQRSSIPVPFDFLLQILTDPLALNYVKLNNESWAKITALSRDLDSGFNSVNFYLKRLLKEINSQKDANEPSQTVM